MEEHLKAYFENYQKRSPLASRRGWLERTIKGWCQYNKLYNINESGIVIDGKMRTTNRLDQASIPPDVKAQYTMKATAKYMVPWDNSKSCYLVPDIPFEVSDVTEATDEFENYTKSEVLKFTNELITLKEKFREHDGQCKYHKYKIEEHLEENDLQEVKVGDYGVAIQVRISMRLSQPAIPLEIKQKYYKKFTGYSWTFYRQADHEAALHAIEVRGLHLLKPTKTDLDVQVLDMEITE